MVTVDFEHATFLQTQTIKLHKLGLLTYQKSQTMWLWLIKIFKYISYTSTFLQLWSMCWAKRSICGCEWFLNKMSFCAETLNAKKRWCNCLVNLCPHTYRLHPATKMTDNSINHVRYSSRKQSPLISMPSCDTSDLTEAGASLKECCDVRKG